MELGLLKERFPNNSLVGNCGNLVNEFFCARTVASHSYEGRLFLTEKALFFVSTFSVEISYDTSFSLDNVKEVTALQRFLPSIEFKLKEGKEVFTNFHDLIKTTNAIKNLLPQYVRLEIKKQALHPKYNRLTSLPTKQLVGHTPLGNHTHHPLQSVAEGQSHPCPYFAQSGFCPRQDFCRFSHDHKLPQTSLSSPTSPRHTQVKTNSTERLTSRHKLKTGQPNFLRSISSPAYSNDNTTEVDKQTLGDQTQVSGSTGDLSSMATSPHELIDQSLPPPYEEIDSVVHSNDPVDNTQSLESQKSKEPEEIKTKEQEEEKDGSRTPEPVSKHDRPSQFVQELVDKVSVPHPPRSFVFGQPKDNTSDQFVFSATGNEGPSHHPMKRKKAAGDIYDTNLQSPPPSPPTGNGNILAEVVGQLELEDEMASLEGDLDLESQQRMLDSFKVQQEEQEYDIINESTEEDDEDDVVKPGHIPIPPPPPPYPGDSRCYYEYGSYSGSEDEEFPPVIMPSQLLVYPASQIGREDINSGDKIILSPEILMACEQRQLTYPMAFCLENKSEGKMVHAGVLEFTSPLSSTAYLPQWMFDHLSINEGTEVDFQHVDLPKGKFVQLQPVSSAWLGVPYDKRMAIMEFQLRNFQTLTEGTKVTIVYELNRYTFKVLRCKPAKGISIVDADLTTDVVEPADFNRFHSIEEWQAENVPIDESIQCTLTAGTYRHFVLLSLPGRELPSKLKIEVKHESGDPDLFLCQTCSTPSQSRYTWCCQDVGDAVIVLNTEDKDYDIRKSLFAGVVSLCEDTKFKVCFHSEQATNGGASSTTGASIGHVLRSSTGDSAMSNTSGTSTGHMLRSNTGSSGTSSLEGDKEEESTDGSEAPPIIPPGHEQCSYCGSIMPHLRLLMHERHCAQSTFKCPICKQCFPKSAEKKHHYIAHELLTCECGVELPQLPLHHHQLTQCVKRSVKCPFKWCQLSFPLDQMEDHENKCGRKQVSCPVCSEDVPQLELEMHLEAFHYVEVDKLDWTRPVSSQTLSYKKREPTFKCHCGTGFDFEDDLQVHQLTECTPEPLDGEDIIG